MSCSGDDLNPLIRFSGFPRSSIKTKTEVVEVRRLAPLTKEEWERKEKEKTQPDVELNRKMYTENSKKVKEEYNYVLNRSPPTTHEKTHYKTFRAPNHF